MKIFYSSNFSKSLKKLNKNLLNELNLNLIKISNNPEIGTLKKGDLASISNLL
jgi:mRNA-degrading endonuclease RelE of RelBE toxin-antitoxin system